MPAENMSDFVDEILEGKKKKPLKKKEIKESEIDVNEIIAEDEKVIPSDDDEEEKEEEKDEEETLPIPDEEETDQEEEGPLSKEDVVYKSQRAAKAHTMQGDSKVMEVSMSLDGKDLGKIEVGSDEYGTLTDINSILDLYDLSSAEVLNAELDVTSITITAQEEVSQSDSDKENVSIMMRMNKDGTLGINVLVNEIGQTFNDLNSAIAYFDRQYQSNILDTINKTARS